jgi:rubrerythrin
MATVKLVPVRRGRIFECFDCGDMFVLPFYPDRCPSCGSDDSIYLMN